MQSLKTSKSRENILGKIRSGLKSGSIPMPFPEVDKLPVSQVYADNKIPVEEQFAAAFLQLGGKFVYCGNNMEFAQNIQLLADSQEWKRLLCSEARIQQILQQHGVGLAESFDRTIEDAEACITSCEYLVARTGSVFISSRQENGRIAPVYYPIHIIVAYTSQLVYDIEDGLNGLTKKYGTELPSMINLNTGPSRTADIEKTLVVGVHGPGEVYLFLIEDQI